MNERDLFLAALEIEDPEARQIYLGSACVGDAELLARVNDLFSLHAEESRFLAVPIVEQMGNNKSGLTETGKLVALDTASQETATIADSRLELPADLPGGFFQPPTRPDSQGRLGHYEILGVIGTGAFGAVLKAHDEKLNRVVAVKLFSPKLAANSTARELFLKEARAAASIRHENVVRIYAVEDEPTPYLVMEYIPGPTLQGRMDEQGPLDVSDVLKIGKQIADGIAAAHAQQLIHLDVKPGNILLESNMEDHVTITDFGVARAVDDTNVFQNGMIIGTPLYMAPEQASGKKLDQRSDMFSIGSVLYHMITGQPPFSGSSTMEVLKQVMGENPRPIREIVPDTPEWLCQIVTRLLEKKANERFASAKELSNLLGQCLTDIREGRTPQIPWMIAANPELDRKSATRKLRKKLGWSSTAALMLLILLGITEATGATKLGSVVMRLALGSGTLVIETTEPGVTVDVNGEVVTIRGGGVKELILRPGDYTVVARKDGQTILQELVTITRDDRTAIQVKLESSKSIDAPVSPHPAKRRIAKNTPRKLLSGHTTAVYTLVYSPNGQLLASGGDGDVHVWDTKSGRCRYIIREENQARFVAITFSPDGKYILTAPSTFGRPAPIHIWEADTGRSVDVLEGHTSGLYDLSFSPDGKTLISGGHDPYLLLWDFVARRKIRDIPSATRWARSAIFSSRGQIAFGQDKVFLADTDGKLVRTIHKSAGPLCFSPDGRLLAGTTWKAGVVTVWNADTGEEIGSWKAHQGYAEGLSFSRDGSLIATAGGDCKVRLWDYQTQKLVAELPQDQHANWVAFSPNGKSLATAGRNRIIKIWDMPKLSAKQAKKGNKVGLSAADQLSALAGELKRRNPGFDGVLNPVIEGGAVVELSINTEHMTDISPLKSLRKLRKLGFITPEGRMGRLSHLAPLKGLPLTSLIIHRNPVADLSPLRGMPLKHFECYFTRVSNLAPLVGLPLENLHLSYSSVENLHPLRDLPLQILFVEGMPITDLSPLRNMRLKRLGLYGTQVQDLSPLRGMPLEYLNCEDTRVTDLSPLTRAPLKSLCISRTNISDLSPLQGIALEEFLYERTSVKDVSILKDMPLRMVYADFQPQRDQEVWRSISSLQKINSKDPDEFWEAEKAAALAKSPDRRQVSPSPNQTIPASAQKVN